MDAVASPLLAPGVRAKTRADAIIPPISWDANNKIARKEVRTPVSHKATVMAGL